MLGLLAYGWLTDFASVGVAMIFVAIGLAFTGEIVEAWIGFRMTRRYGGSKRAGWGALAGGLIGAVVGVPVPIIGSVVGALVGAFVGAAVFEYSHSRRADVAAGAGWGAVLGRAVAAAAKIGFALVIGVMGVFAMMRG